jgi:geranylgeranyl pyrophosphate synthase
MVKNMLFEQLKGLILSLEEFQAWPEVRALITDLREIEQSSFSDYTYLSSEAVSGNGGKSLFGMAAIVCLTVSIKLVDDMLDEDPNGYFHKVGKGITANMAMSFQAAALTMIEKCNLSSDIKYIIQANLSKAALKTAYGQHLDVTHSHNKVNDEAYYWNVVQAKTPPLIGTALMIGALFGEASDLIAQQLERLGLPIGKLIQVSDDLSDVFSSKINPDWTSPNNNLALLYAIMAEYPEKNRFQELISNGVESKSESIKELKQILIKSGGLSYCCYHMIESYKEAQQILGGIPLLHPDKIYKILYELIEPLKELFSLVGIDVMLMLKSRDN